jgi:hypothetical protein
MDFSGYLYSSDAICSFLSLNFKGFWRKRPWHTSRLAVESRHLPGGTEVKHKTISVVKVGVLPKLDLASLEYWLETLPPEASYSVYVRYNGLTSIRVCGFCLRNVTSQGLYHMNNFDGL